ncbi:Poly(A) polymerase I isoform B [Glycine soja]|uniref:Poly(A) polymerase I isoform B n=1 Tax=Glycine soja TaxID=3848 RepID=A0A445L2V4_GLYSO|nr:Poly(A) polymerase I isoform B [Glycine soja]
MIGSTTKKVLNGLRKKGYDVYLVGGCVRDLILKKTPKDFDIITSAELKEVTRTFSWSEIVGKRFPVCHVHMDDTIVEVSSFDTTKCKAGMEFSHHIEAPSGCGKKDHLRWMNCLNRDFTINGLMLDPYARIAYDYFGGIEDIRKAKVRTVIPAETSFQEDCARILRAIRIAARLGFSISKETAHFIKNLSSSVLSLDKGRLLMEMNYMLAFGSGEASLRLLWKFGLLDILLPFQAAYFAQHGFQRRDRRTNMLLSLFSNLDKLLAPNRPCHNSLWVGILALHKALSDRPRNPLAVAAFSLAVHNGGNLLEAVSMAGMINKPHDVRFPELLDPSGLDAEALEAEILDLAESVRGTILQMTNEYFVSQAMADYPQAPRSNLPKFTPGFTYENTVNTLLTSLVNSVSFANHNNFTFPASSDVIYGLFQCRSDLTNDRCSHCLSHAVTHLGNLYFISCDGVLQLDNCFVNQLYVSPKAKKGKIDVTNVVHLSIGTFNVFIPITLYVKVYNMFDCVRRSTVKKFLSKQHRKIDYQSLALGNLQEVRHVFARIVFDTVYPLCPNQNQSLRSNCISQGG